jgi:hypothetical protein
MATNLSWVQNKYSDLGVPEGCLKCAGDPNPSVRLSAYKLAISLLEGGNTLVQMRFLHVMRPESPIITIYGRITLDSPPSTS